VNTDPLPAAGLTFNPAARIINRGDACVCAIRNPSQAYMGCALLKRNPAE